MKTAVLIDGGYLRACAKVAKKKYDNAFIERFSAVCRVKSEYLFRIFYCDAPQFRGTVKLPVSGGDFTFS